VRRGGYFATLAGATARSPDASLRPPRRVFAPEPVLQPSADLPGERRPSPRSDAPAEPPPATREREAPPPARDAAEPPAPTESATAPPEPPALTLDRSVKQPPALVPRRATDPAPASAGRSPTRTSTPSPPRPAETQAEMPGEPHLAFRPPEHAAPVAVTGRHPDAVGVGRPLRTPRLHIGAIDVTVVPPHEPEAPRQVPAFPARPRPTGPSRPSPWFGLAQR
jgi:hypothetical protein